MSGLEDFRGHVWLDGAEKRYRMIQLAAELCDGQIDPEMVEVLERFNAVAWLCTTQCCSGHGGEKKPHVDLRTALGFDELWGRSCAWIERHGATLTVCGSEMGMPRFCFWLPEMPIREAVAAFKELARLLGP